MTNLSALRGGTPPLRIVSGAGVRVTDSHGKEYLEGMAGLWCTSFGWGNEELVQAAGAQMRDLSYYHGFGGRQVPAAEELAAKLIESAPERLRGGRVFFGLSGSDANDTQVRLLWNYNRVVGRPEKRKVISRKRGYHGVTVAAGSLTGLPYVHGATGLPLDFVRHVSCPSFYREGLPGETEPEFVSRLAAELDAAIREEGAETVAAFIAEPVQGAGGVVPPPAGYFEAVGAVCAAHDVLVIGDEVITGFGRTGRFWGGEAVGQRADMLTCAKQLTSGYLPLSATLLPAFMYDALEEATRASGGVFGHGFTYTGHPAGCAVALKVLEITARDRVVEAVEQTLGPAMQARLQALGAHALVGEARGIGLIGGLELVADKETRAPFDPAAGVGAAVVAAALEHGLIVRRTASNARPEWATDARARPRSRLTATRATPRRSARCRGTPSPSARRSSSRCPRSTRCSTSSRPRSTTWRGPWGGDLGAGGSVEMSCCCSSTLLEAGADRDRAEIFLRDRR